MMTSEPLNQDIATEIITDHLPIVRFLACRLARRLPPNIEVSDLVQVGTMGLYEAIKRFDPTMGIQFKSFAEHRIRGAMIDELRKQDALPRSARDLEKLLERVKLEFERKFMRPPAESEIAEKLKVSVDRVREIEVRVQPRAVLSIDQPEELSPADKKALQLAIQQRGGDPLETMEAQEKLERILEGHEVLDRAAFILHFVWGFDHKEIAHLYGVTESRVCQRVLKVKRGIRE